MIVKGNEVKSNRNGKDGLVLAITKDGKRAKVYVYGSDGVESWVKLSEVTLTVSGTETCWKCGGSGLYYFGGAVVNGTYTGRTGPCFGCQGTGMQNNDDRLRNHYYHHRRSEDYNPVDNTVDGKSVEYVEPVKPLAHPKVKRRKAARTVKTVHGTRSTTPATDAAEGAPRLIDCECGFLHLDNVPCI